MIFDGRAFAAARRAALQQERRAFGQLTLGIVITSEDPVTSSYVRIKEKNAAALGVILKRYLVPQNAATADAIKLISGAEKDCDGVIVQLPLPPALDAQAVVDAMSPEKDIDVIAARSAVLFDAGNHIIMPPVASAINEIIDAYDIAIENRKVVVVGKGRLVGRPAHALMRMRGAAVVALDQGDDIAAHTGDADIVILGAGSPALLKPDMVKEGVVVFDAGTSESGGAIVGDADPSVAEKASFFTPVPGGIGPVAVVEMFANLITLKKNITYA